MNSLNDLLEMTTEMVTNIVKEAWENGFAEGKKEKDAGLQVCPFCGGEPMVTTTRSSTWGNDLWNVCCKCGASTGWFESKEAAIEVWNRRAE